MGLFEKLLMAGRLRLKDGEITMLGEPMVFAPVATFVMIIKAFNNSPEIGKTIYQSSKMTDVLGFTRDLVEKVGVKPEKIPAQMRDIATMSGWSMLDLVDVDFENKRAIIQSRSNPIANMYGKSEFPVDHAIRGFVAGALVHAFKTDMDAVETKCISMGNPKCEFVCKPVGEFKESELVDRQLPNKKEVEPIMRFIESELKDSEYLSSIFQEHIDHLKKTKTKTKTKSK